MEFKTIFTSIILPLVLAFGTTAITNFFLLRQKQEDLKNELMKIDKENDFNLKQLRFNEYYTRLEKNYNKLIETVGDFAGDTSNLDKLSKAMIELSRARVYADDKLMFSLDMLRGSIEDYRGQGATGKIPDCNIEIQNRLDDVAKRIGEQLQKINIL